jgi:hypothetical protein
MIAFTFEAFYSHSFDRKDKEICDIFKSIFESFGFNIYEHKQREGQGLSDEIINHIKEKDVFIGVITKNSSWLKNEMSIAYALKKDKVLIFYEKDIDVDGVLNESKIWKVPFERDNLLDSIIHNNILGNIYKFKEDLLEVYFPFYMYEEIYAVRKIIDKNNYEIRERRTVISLNDLLKEIPYSSRVISGNDLDISVKEPEKNFSFEVLEKPLNKQVNFEIKRNDSQEFKFVTQIHPNLSKGEKLKYQFKIKRKNLKKLYKEEINIHKKQQYSVYNNTYFQRTNIVIEQPTKKLVLEVEFPEKYKIGEYGCYVFLNKTSNRNKNEEQRVKVELIDRIDKQIVRLKAIYPKINHNYHLYWEPPFKKDFENE